MAVGWLIGIGTALQAIGQIQSNSAEARQERQNAEYYRRQAEYARFAADREAKLATFSYAQKISTQASKYTSAGVSTASGSALTTMGGTYGQLVDELITIKKKGDLEYDLAFMRGQASESRASALTDPMTTLFSIGGLGMNRAADIVRATS